jgi:hypothetical protein
MKTNFICGGQFLAANAESNGLRDVLFYSGTPVIRFGADRRPFHLSFSMDAESADLSLLNSGRAPFVYDHIEDVDHTLGFVEKGWIGGDARASVRFSDREELKGIISDIESGVLSNISMGARIIDLVKAPSVEKGVPHLLAAKWQPYHISLVSRGADPNAQFLSACLDDVPAELLADISADTGEARNAEEEAARYALAIKRHRARIFGL